MGVSLDMPQTVEWQGKQVPVWPAPVIDYGRLLSQDPEEVDKVLKACMEEGYFNLDLQGIEGRRMLADQEEIQKLMKKFFAMPIEAKNEFGLISSHLGYVSASQPPLLQLAYCVCFFRHRAAKC
jgi:hypothetical protein